MSNWNGLGSSWQYSRWTKNIARNARITNPTLLEALIYRSVVAIICEPMGGTGTRPWLTTSFNKLSVTAAGSEYQFNYILEPIAVIVKAMEIIGRDFKKIPITDYERAVMNFVFAMQEITIGFNRRYGTTPLYGNVGGSTVAIP